MPHPHTTIPDGARDYTPRGYIVDNIAPSQDGAILSMAIYGVERFVAIVTRNLSSKFFPTTKSVSIVAAICSCLY